MEHYLDRLGYTLLLELKVKQDYLDYADSILMIHGTKDEIIPFAVSERFADEKIIEFLPVEGADHRFQNPKHMETAIKAIIAFFGF